MMNVSGSHCGGHSGPCNIGNNQQEMRKLYDGKTLQCDDQHESVLEC